MDKWVNAPSITYKHDMIDPSRPDDHWLTTETHEQGRRRCYQEWPNDGASLVNDGDEIWTVDWKRNNPPSIMSGMSYFFINIVWMTQVDILEKRVSFHTVRLTFTGSSPHEYFDMYIDPKTNLLRGGEIHRYQ